MPRIALAGVDPNDPPWKPYYEDAVYFLAGHYAAEQVRKRQEWAISRSGVGLSAKEIADIFKESAEYMTAKIQRTSKTDGETK